MNFLNYLQYNAKNLILSFLPICISITSAAQTYQWAKNIGSGASEESYHMMVDGNSNIYLTGYFQLITDFDPGPGTANLSPVFGIDAFFAKYDSNGNYLWAKQLGSQTTDEGKAIAVDNNSNIYVTGYYGHRTDFDPGSATYNLWPYGKSDIYVARYDSNGIFNWAKRIGSKEYDAGNGIAIDPAGNVYVTGFFSDTTDFADTSIFGLSPGIVNFFSNGDKDIFIAKYDSSGNYLWTKTMGSTGSDEAKTIALDTANNLYFMGRFSGTVDFDAGGATANLSSSGTDDLFIAKYDKNGNYLWANKIGSSNGNDAYGEAITVDDNGNLYITGYYQGTVDFDPGTNTSSLSSAGGNDIFFAGYDMNGNYLWAKSIGTANNDKGNGIQIQPGGNNLYITGSFGGTADFDPATTIANLTPVGLTDIFFARYDANGNYIWAQKIGSPDYDAANSIFADGVGNVWITGLYQGTTDFDPGAGTANLPWAGAFDIYFAKYSEIGLSVDENIMKNEWIILPNPAVENFSVHTFLNENVRLTVSNMLGEIILTDELIPEQCCSKTYSTHSMVNGIYCITLQTQSGKGGSKKIIISK